MTTQSKPRYPSVVFHRLKNYPLRHCQNPECRKQLTPRYTLYQGKHHKLETVATFKTRKFCGMTCTGRARALKLAEEREQRVQTLLGEAARNAETKRGREEASTPIPASFILQPELAKQGVTTIEQVEAMTDDELLVLPRVSKAKLKMLRSQIAGVKKEAPDRTPQDAETGLLADEHKEAPTLTDPAYGGPPAPAEVTEEVESAFDQVADQAEQVESDPETWRPGELKTGQLIAGWIPEARKDPALNRPVRPVKLPSTTPPQRPPIPPPSLQARLPDPRPQTAPYTVTEGEIIERADFGTCPNEGCGERLNAFGKCRNCEQRVQWLKGQRAKVGSA